MAAACNQNSLKGNFICESFLDSRDKSRKFTFNSVELRDEDKMSVFVTLCKSSAADLMYSNMAVILIEQSQFIQN